MKLFWGVYSERVHWERVHVRICVKASGHSHVSNVVALIRYLGLRMFLIFFLMRACGGVTTGPSDSAESGDNSSPSTGASTEEEAHPAKPFTNLSPGLSICEYFSLTLDYKETGTITSPDFPNHYGNHSQCSMLLSACPLCRINIKVNVLQLVNCDKKKRSKLKETSPKKKPSCQTNCDFLLVEDPHYSILGDSYVILQGSGGGPYEYTSISNDVRLIFCGTSNYVAPKRFKITYDVIDFKVANVTGTPNARGVINSPNFPETYISPHTYYYYLTNTDFEGKVRLTFDDFDIHQESKLVVIDGDSSTSFYSWSQRPVYESKSRKIQINYISSMEFWDKLDVWVIKTGFKITYEFVSADGSWDVKPDTGCDATEKDGGLLVLHSTPRFGAATAAGRGGARREGVLSAGGNVASWQPLDCIWVIKPSSYDNAVYAKLLQLKSAVTSAFNRLDIREGVNSVAPLLLNLQDSLNYPVDGANGGIPTEFVSRTGFYIRLSMVYSKLDLFEMVYAGFHNQTKGGTCPFRRGFPCNNGRCVNEDLRCDSYDHCGDGSDESEDAKCFRVDAGGRGGKKTNPPSTTIPTTTTTTMKKPTEKPTKKPTKRPRPYKPTMPTKLPQIETKASTTGEPQRSGNMRMNNSNANGGGNRGSASGIFGGALDTSMGMAIGITVGSAIIIVVIATLIIVVGRTKYRHLQSQWQLAERIRRRHRSQSGSGSGATATTRTWSTASSASMASPSNSAALNSSARGSATTGSRRRNKPRKKKLKKMRKSKKDKGISTLPPSYLEAISSPPFHSAQSPNDASTSSASEQTTSSGLPVSITLPPPAYQPSDSDTDTQAPPPRPHPHQKTSILKSGQASAFRTKSLPAPAPPSVRIGVGSGSGNGSGRGETTITLQGTRPRPPERNNSKKGVAFQSSTGKTRPHRPLSTSSSYPMSRVPTSTESYADASLPCVSEESDCEVLEILRRPPRFDPLEVLPPLSREERSVIRSTSLETVQEDPDNSTSYL